LLMQSEQKRCVHPSRVATSDMTAGASRQMGQVKSSGGLDVGSKNWGSSPSVFAEPFTTTGSTISTLSSSSSFGRLSGDSNLRLVLRRTAGELAPFPPLLRAAERRCCCDSSWMATAASRAARRRERLGAGEGLLLPTLNKAGEDAVCERVTRCDAMTLDLSVVCFAVCSRISFPLFVRPFSPELQGTLLPFSEKDGRKGRPFYVGLFWNVEVVTECERVRRPQIKF